MNELDRFLQSAGPDGRTALVTGAAGAIGAATVRKLSEDGFKVIATDLSSAGLEAAFGRENPSIVCVEHNVASQPEWQSIAVAISSADGRLNALVNNAGSLQKPLSVENCPEEEFRRVIDVNLIGTFLGIKLMTRFLREASPSAIVNVSSAEAFATTPGCGAYSASKYAVRGLTKTVAVELAAEGIRCNSIHPWAIDSAMARGDEGSSTFAAVVGRVPMRRAGSPEEAAELISFLVGPKSSFSTGGEFMIDGGHIAWSGY